MKGLKGRAFQTSGRRGVVARRRRHCCRFILRMFITYCSLPSALIHKPLFLFFKPPFFTFDDFDGDEMRFLCDIHNNSRQKKV